MALSLVISKFCIVKVVWHQLFRVSAARTSAAPCSRVLACVESGYLPSQQSHLFITSPGKKRWHALMPGMADRWGKKKERWLSPVTSSM